MVLVEWTLQDLAFVQIRAKQTASYTN